MAPFFRLCARAGLRTCGVGGGAPRLSTGPRTASRVAVLHRHLSLLHVGIVEIDERTHREHTNQEQEPSVAVEFFHSLIPAAVSGTGTTRVRGYDPSVVLSYRCICGQGADAVRHDDHGER